MASLWTLALVLFAGTACSGEQLDGPIAGGSLASMEQYPYIVQVEASYLGWTQMCAGTILNSLCVLTAANCFELHYSGPNSRRVRAGASVRNAGGDIHYVTVINKHPSWPLDRFGRDGDIAVIQISTPFRFGPTIQPVTIISQNSDIPDNSPVVNVGWNTIRSNGIVSYQLLHVTVNTVNNQLCKEQFLEGPHQGNVTENMICVGISDINGSDACQGDIGGPVFYENIQIGVVSWGYNCDDVHSSGVTTRVASYTDWIVATSV